MTERVVRGKVHKLGDFVNTDIIAPGRWMHQGMDVLRVHTMEAIRPEFYKEIRPGDIVVGGRNFGCGSHREQATEIMQFLGVAAIVADSIGRLYFRNGIAFGLPIFGAAGISGIVEQGEELEITMGAEWITFRNVTRSLEVTGPPLPEVMARVLEVGGVYELLKLRLAEEARAK